MGWLTVVDVRPVPGDRRRGRSTDDGTAERVAAVLDRYEAVIGIEIHCQLKTASKMFCGCSTAYDGAAPNTHVCPVCLGLPGTLPVINRRAVEFVIATGLAIEGSIPERTQWERKNYFYPDLPKGYQISQYAIPLASDGRLAIETSDGPFTVRIRRAHLEEDTAKLVHGDVADAAGARTTLVDFNRSGAPLMEIVTEPDIRTAEQARRYAEELQLLMRAIGASDADMERGQMRVEANVSLRPRGEEPFGTRVEVKNMNSFRSVERAIGYEIERQGRMLDAGEPLSMETRGWDDGRQATYRMRVEGDVRGLPLLPGARPAAAPRGAGVDRRRPLRRCPSCPRPAARATRRWGSPHYDAAVIVADPGDDRRVRGDLGRRTDAAGEGGRQLRDRGRTRAPRRPPASTRPGPPGASTPGRDRRAPRRDRRGPGLAAGRAASCSTATSPTARPRTSCSPAPGPARSPTTPRCSATSTRSSPPTRRPSRTTARASRSPGSSSAR